MLKVSRLVIQMILILLTMTIAIQALQLSDLYTIPNENGRIQIRDWDRKLPKKQIFEVISRTAKSGDIDLIFSRTTYVNEMQQKNIFDFSSHASTKYSLGYDIKIHKLSNEDLALEEMKGIFFTNALDEKLDKLLATFKEVGLTVEYQQSNLIVDALVMVMTPVHLVIFFSLLSLLALVLLIDRFKNLKRYGVMKLMGLRLSEIVKIDTHLNLKYSSLAFVTLLSMFLGYLFLKFDISVMGHLLWQIAWMIILVFLITLLIEVLSYLVLLSLHVAMAIKGENAPGLFLWGGMIIKAFFLIILVTNTTTLIGTVQSYQQTQQQLKSWLLRPDSYTMNYSFINEKDKGEVDHVESNTHRLIASEPDALIANTNHEHRPSLYSYTIENGNVLTVNTEYFKHNPVYLPNGRLLRQAHFGNSLYILLPENRLGQRNQVIKSVESTYQFQRQLFNSFRNQAPIKLELMIIKSEQKHFNYTVGEELSGSIARNPILVVIDNKLFSDNFYFATNSREMIHFSSLSRLKNKINQFGLSSFVAGITSAKTKYAKVEKESQVKLFLIVSLIILSFVQIAYLISFLTSLFIQKYSKKIALLVVFGRSAYRAAKTFITVNIILDLVALVCGSGFHQSIVFYIGAGAFILVELLCIMLIIHQNREHVIKVLRDGS